MSNTFINFPQYVVRDANGNVDIALTQEKFNRDLSQYCATRELELHEIENAIGRVLDKYSEATLNVGFVVSQAVSILNPDASAYAVVQKKVNTFLTENSKGDNPKYFVSKGQSKFGVLRYSDYLAKKAKLEAENMKTVSVQAAE